MPDVAAVIERAEAAERELADARHVIDQCEQDRNVLAVERDEARAERDALASEVAELRRLIANARNQLNMAEGTVPRR